MTTSSNKVSSIYYLDLVLETGVPLHSALRVLPSVIALAPCSPVPPSLSCFVRMAQAGGACAWARGHTTTGHAGSGGQEIGLLVEGASFSDVGDVCHFSEEGQLEALIRYLLRGEKS